MIDKSEIMEFSREFGLRANVIEKDYVLGWVLAGIFNHPVIGSSWLFKGGTCLKKCFFETYRFSEDLDFTLSESNHLDQEFFVSCFKEIAQWVYNETGIEIPQDLIRFDVYQNKRGFMSAQGRIGYRGPMQPRGDLPRIKLDLTTDEIVVLDPVIREVHHPYSDLPSDGIRIKSYCFEEVFAEKIRALAERERPKDLYDVVHLYRHDELDPDQPLILNTLEKKCAFKQIPVPTMDTFRNRSEHDELETEWENMLAHQLPALPPFNQFWQALPEVIEWLHGLVAKTVKVAIPIGRQAIDATWRPPAMAQAWHVATPLERIRFAAANRLCVNLHYQNKYRLVEPYSLRRTQEGNILLYALRHETNKWRAYRVDRIQGAEITQTPFVPKHAVELTPASISIPVLTRRSGGYDVFKSAIPRSSFKRQSLGPKYVIECPYCGKKFSRKKMNTRLNPHKDKYGYPCSGRNGYLVDTKI
ncbi:MAG: nucleotidyl transferase AbiEii/AbiGii toxin family protein [Desulfobacterales bacterium]|nr:nucleotidyl transferase AbiEii/AbiGii toxin family protein [Desulfobacterales bacterium]